MAARTTKQAAATGDTATMVNPDSLETTKEKRNDPGDASREETTWHAVIARLVRLGQCFHREDPQKAR